MITAMKSSARDGIYLRGRTWWISYRLGGRRVRESTGFADRRAAELALAKVKVGIKEGKWFEKRVEVTTPLREAVDNFLTLYSRVRKASWRDDELVLSRLCKFAGANAGLQQFDRMSIEQFLKSLLTAGCSRSRVNRHVAVLKSFWNRQIEWGKAESNPIRGIKMYPESIKTEYLEASQVHSLLAACSPRLRPIVQTAVLTGLRRGDIFNLRWDSVDFARRQISVLQGKTGVPLTLPLGVALADLFASIPRQPDCPYIFHHRGRALKKFGWVRTDYLAACKVAGIPENKRRFHALRHTVATQMRFLGKDLAIIKEQLGHKSLRMTIRYAHVASEELKKVADELGERLVGGRTVDSAVVTNWSQSTPVVPCAELHVDKNGLISRDESHDGDFGTEKMQLAVNARQDRREAAQDDALRRADDDWG